jgi:anti-anti-sigma factor
MKLTYKPLANEDILRVACEGQVSVRGRSSASDPFLDLLGPHAYRQRIILNLERADGVDTSGLMWLVKAAFRCGQEGGHLVVYGFTPTFKQMLEALGLTGSMAMASSEQLAIEAVNASSNGSKRGAAGEARPVARAFMPPDTDAG